MWLLFQVTGDLIFLWSCKYILDSQVTLIFEWIIWCDVLGHDWRHGISDMMRFNIWIRFIHFIVEWWYYTDSCAVTQSTVYPPNTQYCTLIILNTNYIVHNNTVWISDYLVIQWFEHHLFFTFYPKCWSPFESDSTPWWRCIVPSHYFVSWLIFLFLPFAVWWALIWHFHNS